MRKVKFEIWENNPTEANPRHNSFVSYEGLFHQWGYDTTEEGGTIGTDTIAIVELPDGRIKTPFPKNVQFID